ncbi:MAG TPA: hypothetical protein VGP11_04730, partial [Acidimicrobiales bacterium]|nr:hypothetical protein [Acidimicrobiales bacterium]
SATTHYGSGSSRGQRLLRQTEGSKKVSNPHHLIFGEFACAGGPERHCLTFDRYRPIPSVRLVHLAKASEQRTHVMPLNIVVQRVTKEFLSGDTVVMI